MFLLSRAAADFRQHPLSKVRTSNTLDHTNAHAAVYPSQGLDIIRRRSQRRLVGAARLKLRSIPATAYGLICIQTVGSKRFAPDIHRLIERESSRMPLSGSIPSATVKRVEMTRSRCEIRYSARQMTAKRNTIDYKSRLFFITSVPYHHARLNAAADRLSVTGIEWSAKDMTPISLDDKGLGLSPALLTP